MRVRFGPAGKPLSYKGKTEGIPEFLRQLGLDAFEYQAVRSLRVSEERARGLGAAARKNDVAVSLHGPYAINLSSDRSEVREASVDRLVRSAVIASWMGASLVVFHPGYYGSLGREEAVAAVINGLERVLEGLKEAGVGGIYLGVETTGKVKQVGSLEEVIEICSAVEGCKPVLDFAHIHARSGGSLRSLNDFLRVLDAVERELGCEALSPAHIHFTEVEYGEGGEVRHHQLGSGFGPNFKLLAEALVEVGVDATIISESPVLERDALKMKRIYERVISAR
ncbi:MAG: deoxyribonuclease IV [Thermoprotei archaeon]|nr:MAG: deoxyribonuclease IV [Thermoprotei archaeon]